ncbi:outer membrane receptor protein involved in Fe transport [Novosphingobium sp. PhB165]|uniref:TonB-dependent receptor domain-containing protein n=1 Tax=Novosphingobium sp. PhB165 TaxID=2485105 RepID=UPI0010ECC9C4|nr:TonB-dependent receptor [Novosphingobium sp. PhB165]TCM17066.1 outer membrane receptor protein involved in Fe transport [Novosphingobium sp. PhB165]
MATLALGVWSSPEVCAREAAGAHIDVTATRLPDAIAELSREAHVSIGTDGPLPAIPTRPLHGVLTVGDALARLLAGSGYRARQVGETAWRIEHVPAPQAPVPSEPRPVEHVAPPETAFGPPIIVTATKQPLELSVLPAAVSVVSAFGIGHDDPRRSSAAVAGQVDGLALTALGPGRNRMFLRGVADSAFGGESQSTVAVVLDEARLTYAAPDPDLRLVDIQRVEVLKGPQGSLYGTGALGGIYHMVSHQADLDESSLTLTGGGSMAAHGENGYSGSAVANVPLLPGTAGLRLVGYMAQEPGWVDTGTRTNGNTTQVTGLRGLLGIEPVSGWRIDVTGLGQWIASRDSRYVYDEHSYSRPAQLPEPHDNDLTHLAGRLTGKLGDIDVMLATAMTWHDVGDTLDATIGADDFGIADPKLLIDKRDYRTWDSELRLRGHLGGIGWLAGLSHLDARQSLDTTLQGMAGESLVVDADHRDSHDTAAYFDVTVPLLTHLSLDGGARLFVSSIRDTRQLDSGKVAEEQDKSGVTPSLALAWQPHDGRLIYVRYGSAFRQGGTMIGQDGTVQTLKGDELSSVEAGWRETLAGGGQLDLGGWYSHWDDVQSDVLEDNGLITTTTAGDARILGVEGSLDLPILRGWRAQAGANYTDARLTRNALGYRLEDSRLPVVPEYTARLALRHDFTLGALAVWAQLGGRYVGPARMSFDPALDRDMGDYIESNFELHVAHGQWQVALTAQNLLGDKGNVFAFGNALRYRTMAQYTPQGPTTIFLSASLTM